VRPTGRILIVDDDPSFLQLYRARLGGEGYLVDVATTFSAALTLLDQGGWDVVLVDQKLEGPEGPDRGIDLVAEVHRRAPSAKTILVTGHASERAVARAFQEGAYDYLEKGPIFRVLLLAKLRNALEAVRAHHFGELSEGEAESAIRDTWTLVETETDPNRKGKLLEDLMVLVLKTIPGFRHASARRRNEEEEIDVVIRNESVDPFWVNERTSYILAECKNWTRPAGATEIRSFLWKLSRKYNRSRLGLFIAPGGFSAPLKSDLHGERRDDFLVLLLGREDLRGLVLAPDRNAFLKALHERAVLEMHGELR
jgi:DNA-binding response OmpR family regulator